ncbi:Transmembrane protein 41A [Mortierella sp. GBA43]|nr:Transmembrane protein 41A [Mortierella sp. GBA43]
MEETKEDIQITAQSTVSSLPRINMQLGFLSRIVILIGLFGMSLGGLYLLAQVLPPLSLPKSIDDVKVDAAILQEFATATYEGWIRTFWVFSVVYMWKQCFGIPGSAFLNILAGALYGPWFGTVLTSLLTTLGSVLAYFMSFFLMEPIMNRYASGSLEQMRLQIQKKAMRSSSSKRSSSQDSSATSTAVQSSITSTDLSMSTSSSAIAAASISSSPSALRGGLLRTRSSSITTRVTDRMEQREISSIYSKTPSTGATVPAYQNVHDENDMQEGKGLLSEERTVDSSILSVAQQVVVEVAHSSIAVEEDEDDQDDSEGTSLFMQLLLIRLFPLTPYWFINLASPLVGVPVIPFMTSMFLGCMPYNYICAQAGAILSEIHELRDIYQQPWILFQIVVVLLLSTVAVLISKRTKKKQLDMEQQRKSRSSEEESANDESTHHLLQSDRHRPSIDSPQDNIAMSSLNPRDSVIEVY